MLNIDAQPGADVQHIAYKMDLFISSVLVVFTLRIGEDEPMFTIVHSYVVLNQCHKNNKKQQTSILPSIFAAQNLDRGFKYLLSSLFGEDSHFDTYFSNGLVSTTN